MVGTGTAIRGGTMHIMAGGRSYPHRSLLKSGDMLDRVLRAECRSGQQKDVQFIEEYISKTVSANMQSDWAK